MNKTPGPRRYFRTQLPVDFINTSITINDWMTADADLSEGEPAKVWYIAVEQTNNGATGETIEFRMRINGTLYTISIAAASGTRYFIYLSANLSAGDFELLATSAPRQAGNPYDADQSNPLVAESIEEIEVRQTTAVDPTAAQVEVNIVWEKLVS